MSTPPEIAANAAAAAAESEPAETTHVFEFDSDVFEFDSDDEMEEFHPSAAVTSASTVDDDESGDENDSSDEEDKFDGLEQSIVRDLKTAENLGASLLILTATTPAATVLSIFKLRTDLWSDNILC